MFVFVCTQCGGDCSCPCLSAHYVMRASAETARKPGARFVRSGITGDIIGVTAGSPSAGLLDLMGPGVTVDPSPVASHSGFTMGGDMTASLPAPPDGWVRTTLPSLKPGETCVYGEPDVLDNRYVVKREPERLRFSLMNLARLLFMTDARAIAIVDRVTESRAHESGESAGVYVRRSRAFDIAWRRERAIRHECLRRAIAVFREVG